MMSAVFRVEAALRAVLKPDKINLASLGNMVPHVHWHVIPRFVDDRHFPDAIWASPRRAASAAVSASDIKPQLLAWLQSALSSPVPDGPQETQR